MPSSSRLLLAVRHRDLPLRSTGRPARAETRAACAAPARTRVRVGPATVFLSEDDYEIDWASFAFVAVDEAYAGDYRRRVGRGPRRAQGLLRRVRAPATARARSSRTSRRRRTSRYLERAAARLRGAGVRWHARREPRSAPRRGEAELHVMGASWGHALHPPEAFARARGRRGARSGRGSRGRPRARRPSARGRRARDRQGQHRG